MVHNVHGAWSGRPCAIERGERAILLFIFIYFILFRVCAAWLVLLVTVVGNAVQICIVMGKTNC